MKTILKTQTFVKTMLLSACAGLLLVVDVPVSPEFALPVELTLVPEAQAILGVRRRAFRRGVIIGSSEEAAAQAQSQPAAAPPPAPAAPPPAAAGAPLPLETVVQILPAGCVSTPTDGIQYYYCGGNFYRASFQGTSVVYVTVTS